MRLSNTDTLSVEAAAYIGYIQYVSFVSVLYARIMPYYPLKGGAAVSNPEAYFFVAVL